MVAPKKIIKLPSGKPTVKQLATLGDLYFTKREERLAAEKVAAAIKSDEDKVKNYLIDNLSKGEGSGVRGAIALVWTDTDPVPVMENRDTFLNYVFKHKEFDLLTNAISSAAVKLRWDNKKTVPGIGRFNAVKLHYSKIK